MSKTDRHLLSQKVCQRISVMKRNPALHQHALAVPALMPADRPLHGGRNLKKKIFDPKKVKKRAKKVAHNRPRPFYFTVQPRPMAHSPELIFHIIKSRDQTSVLLSVGKN